MSDPQQSYRTPYVLQIVDADGVLLRFKAGGIIETAIAEACAKEIAPKIRFFSTEKQRQKAIADGVASVIWKLKFETTKLV